MNRRHRRNSGLLLIIVLVLLAVVIYSGLQILESTVFYSGDVTEPTAASKTVTWEGVSYFPRQDITVIMLLGIDQKGPVVASDSYTNPGNADMVALLIANETDQTITVLNLNRDTMMNIPVLGVGGRPAGTRYAQLTLAHNYGTGMEDSCENTRDAVSGFLGGIRIDYYVSMNMDAIGLLNDAVGGVVVEVEDDFSKIDPTITKGQVRLTGEQALNFIQTRKDVGDQMNLSRMNRHREYMNGFLSAIREKMETDSSFILQEYGNISPYLVSDCSVNTLSTLIDRYCDYELLGIVTPEGENVYSGEFMEFYVDREALTDLVISLFYIPKN